MEYTQVTSVIEPLLDNDKPVHGDSPEYSEMFEKLQGNILAGHGRDFSANIFLEFQATGRELSNLLSRLTRRYVTSAAKQARESAQFKRFRIPGSMFGNLMLTAKTYMKLGHADSLKGWFESTPENENEAFPQNSFFINGMLNAAADMGDRPDKIKAQRAMEPLEQAYLEGTIDALLLLADDSEDKLLRSVRELITSIESEGTARVVAVELGKALRNQDDEGIEHFGYVDGRSQPLFLASDFKNLREDGSIDPFSTTEKVNDKAARRESGEISHWNPFAPLKLALILDKGAKDPKSFGSYFVFRKLEQDVLRFSIAEQQLADALKLEGGDRERAGAMAVGRFRDGTPLVLSETDGLIPAKGNNFRYDGLNANLEADPKSPDDRLGLKCPFHAHIRKTNPRQSLNSIGDTSAQVRAAEELDKRRRIVRRGIPFGERKTHPNAFQTLDDLPTGGVGLLFGCFQSSIIEQFAFMQKTWANNPQFKVPLGTRPDLAATGLDPLIGQPLDGNQTSNPSQHWRREFGGEPGQPSPDSVTNLDLAASHPQPFNFSEFVRFRGGEFFFAPSITFLLMEHSS